MTDEPGGADEVGDYVQACHGALMMTYPDLEFLSPAGSLTLALDRRGVTGVRLQLPRTEFLQLHSVEVVGHDVATLRRTARVTASSSRGNSSRFLDRCLLLDPSENHPAGVRTTRDRRPWCEINFPEPIDVPTLVVRNVPGSNYPRAQGLQVLVKADADWEMVYDGRARVRQVKSFPRVRQLLRPGGPDPVQAAVELSLVQLLLGNHQRASRVLKSSQGISPADRATIRTAVNQGVLAKASLEWTIHGISRSFRYWSESEKSEYTGQAVALTRDIAALTDKVCFGFGSVLGLVREGGVIPHDNDIDLIVGFEPHEAATLSDALDLLQRHLEPLGYRVTGQQHLAHRWVRKPGEPAIDVFAGIFEGDRIGWFPGKRGVLTRQMMYPTSLLSFMGHDCPVPRDPVAYLEQVYGDGWRTPDPAFAHTRERASFDGLAGS